MQTSQRSDVGINKHQREIDPGWVGGSAFSYDFTSAFKDKERSKVNDKGSAFQLECVLFCCRFCDLLSHFPASANRKTFKSSVKPGWYYFGRKMVRARLYFRRPAE